jgi:hypothetical protein
MGDVCLEENKNDQTMTIELRHCILTYLFTIVDK